MPQQPSPVWFITGCSTGFGRELAKLILARGGRVVVTARNPDQIQDLVAGHEANALALPLDVNDPAQIKAAVQYATEKFGQIDILVNNAGYGYLAAIEEGEDAEVRKMFETNFFGLVALTNAVLPGMRERRSGHIVNFSSIGGLVSFGATGYYHATKYAVEGMSESLAIEVAPLGIKVIIVEPGPFRTDWAGRSLPESKIVIPDYDSTAGERRRQTRARSGKQQGDPVRAAAAILKAIESDTPPLRLVLGKPALDLAYKKLESVKKDLDTWKEATLSVDFPEDEVAK
ncbi:oxidoreductase [Granulicella tundricola]|uniref:Short-chain dehydrogenase/reductase SDR n=1 Tax=Granulicella tundricola (strain ATCC BAA-1859 / DSM 23138 / MP5ACTX9) TaxID=1198114 RepID=E8WV86_GRATM|nr:oxidoreductase [Granulicella tundricola]ADW67261.1 short-chain dehydrogenase/reductase SDR [Granulicella tundricola MP5ACTX9]